MEDTPRYDLGGETEPRREVGAVPAAGVAPAAAFDTPTKGTSVQKFREMILNHLKVGLKLTFWTECFHLACLKESLLGAGGEAQGAA